MVRAATETVNAQLLGLQEMLDSLEEVQPTDPQAVSKVNKDAEDRGTAKTNVGKTEIASAPSVRKSMARLVRNPPLRNPHERRLRGMMWTRRAAKV